MVVAFNSLRNISMLYWLLSDASCISAVTPDLQHLSLLSQCHFYLFIYISGLFSTLRKCNSSSRLKSIFSNANAILKGEGLFRLLP